MYIYNYVLLFSLLSSCVAYPMLTSVFYNPLSVKHALPTVCSIQRFLTPPETHRFSLAQTKPTPVPLGTWYMTGHHCRHMKLFLVQLESDFLKLEHNFDAIRAMKDSLGDEDIRHSVMSSHTPAMKEFVVHLLRLTRHAQLYDEAIARHFNDGKGHDVLQHMGKEVADTVVELEDSLSDIKD